MSSTFLSGSASLYFPSTLLYCISERCSQGVGVDVTLCKLKDDGKGRYSIEENNNKGSPLLGKFHGSPGMQRSVTVSNGLCFATTFFPRRDRSMPICLYRGLRTFHPILAHHNASICLSCQVDLCM